MRKAEGKRVVTEKGKELVGNVKLDLRFCEDKIHFIFLIVETLYLLIIFGYINV